MTTDSLPSSLEESTSTSMEYAPPPQRTNVFAYINKLSEELLVHILGLAQKRNIYYNDDIIFRKCPDVGAIRLTHVCRQWRTTVLDAPMMWTNLWVHLWLEGNQVERILAYMDRAKGLTLDIHVEFPDQPRLNMGVLNEDEPYIRPLPDFTAVQRAFNCLIDHTHRWRSLFISTSGDHQRDWVARALKDVCASALEDFAISELYTAIPQEHRDTPADLESSNRSVIRHVVFRGGAPKLRTVLYEGTTAPFCAVPLDKVTNLVIRDSHHYLSMELHELRDLLKAVLVLTHLTLGPEDVVVRPIRHDFGALSLPFLTHLKINSDNDWLFKHLDLPLLTSLDIGGEDRLHSFFSLLQTKPTNKAFPMLRELKFTYGLSIYQSRDLRVLVDELPNIEHAKLEVGEVWWNIDAGPPMVIPMATLDVIAHGWPQLRSLQIEGADKAALMSFLDTRAGLPFERISFGPWFVEQLKKRFPAAIRGIEARGFIIEGVGNDCDRSAYIASWEDGSEES